jgi:hypothetical protein
MYKKRGRARSFLARCRSNLEKRLWPECLRQTAECFLNIRGARLFDRLSCKILRYEGCFSNGHEESHAVAAAGSETPQVWIAVSEIEVPC